MSAQLKLLAETSSKELQTLSPQEIKEKLETYAPDPQNLDPDSEQSQEAATLDDRTTSAAAQKWGRLDKPTQARLAESLNLSLDDQETLEIYYNPPPDPDEGGSWSIL